MQRTLSLITRLCCISIVFALPGCAPDKPGIYCNEQIKAGKRSDFRDLNAKLFEGLKANNANKLEGIMSQEFINDPTKLRQIELLSNRLKEADYDILDEFYIINNPKDKNTIKVTDRGINNYDLHYDTLTHEIYIVHFIPKKNAVRYMITAVYGKYDYGWKVNKFDLNKYAINGKTAPELFKLAKERYAKNYLVDADDIMGQAIDCARPENEWKYKEEKEISAFSNKLDGKVNKKYNFPYTITQVRTQPEIFRVENQKTPDGVFPMIYYLSDIKLADTIALKKENKSIQKVIGTVMPGIDKDKKCVLYSVFGLMPDGTRGKSFDHFDITDRLQP
ncbi:MAG: hypothetical protein ABI203_03630 [Mucilaginibacter sp.]